MRRLAVAESSASGSSKSSTAPRANGAMPSVASSSVVLPAPLRPSSPTTLPAGTVQSSPSSGRPIRIEGGETDLLPPREAIGILRRRGRPEDPSVHRHARVHVQVTEEGRAILISIRAGGTRDQRTRFGGRRRRAPWLLARVEVARSAEEENDRRRGVKDI